MRCIRVFLLTSMLFLTVSSIADVFKFNDWTVRSSSWHCQMFKERDGLSFRYTVVFGDSTLNDNVSVSFRRKTSRVRNVLNKNTWSYVSDWAGYSKEYDYDDFENSTLVNAVLDGKNYELIFQRGHHNGYESLVLFHNTNEKKYNSLLMPILAKYQYITLETLHTKEPMELVSKFYLGSIARAYKNFNECVLARGIL